MHKIYSSLETITSDYKELKNLGKTDLSILEVFFQKGGLIKSHGKDNLEISYPNKEKVKLESEKLKAELLAIEKEIKMWEKTKNDAENYVQRAKVSKYFDPLYWKHVYKKYTDSEYKELFDKTKIPLELISDQKLRKIVIEFMNNKEYRANLAQTMENSLVYKNRSLGEQIIDSIKIKVNIAKKKLDVLYKNKDNHNSQLKAYKIISRWILE